MSYILDALRKSDQQRQLGSAPTLLTVQTPAEPPKQPAYWLYAMLAGVLLGAGVLIGWLHPWETQPPPPEAEIHTIKPLEAQQQIPPTVQPAPPEKKSQPEPQSEPVVQAAAADTRRKTKAPAPARTATPRTQAKAVASPPKEAASALAEKAPEAEHVDAVQELRVMTMAELPLSIRQEIPKMTISLHAYAKKPNERLVSVNDKLLREGDSLAPGLRLEQITPAGMIFSYKGYRFQPG